MDGFTRNAPGEISFDRNNLYREETFSDLQAGSIKKLIPITADGCADAGRPPVFMGQAQVLTPTGPLPIQCMLEATTLSEAIDRFPAAIKEAIDQIVEEARRLRHEAASRIVMPGQESMSKIIR